jgi:hypothetical protein
MVFLIIKLVVVAEEVYLHTIEELLEPQATAALDMVARVDMLLIALLLISPLHQELHIMVEVAVADILVKAVAQVLLLLDGDSNNGSLC